MRKSQSQTGYRQATCTTDIIYLFIRNFIQKIRPNASNSTRPNMPLFTIYLLQDFVEFHCQEA